MSAFRTLSRPLVLIPRAELVVDDVVALGGLRAMLDDLLVTGEQRADLERQLQRVHTARALVVDYKGGFVAAAILATSLTAVDCQRIGLDRLRELMTRCIADDVVQEQRWTEARRALVIPGAVSRAWRLFTSNASHLEAASRLAGATDRLQARLAPRRKR